VLVTAAGRLFPGACGFDQDFACDYLFILFNISSSYPYIKQILFLGDMKN